MTDGRLCEQADGHKGRHRGIGRRAYQAAYGAAHREEKRAYDAAYDAAHREEKRAYNAAHREEKRAYDAAYGASAAGVAKRRRRDRKEQVARLGALIGIPGLTLEQAKQLILELT